MDSDTSKAILVTLGTVATYLWGGFDEVLKALVALACIDYASGVMAAWVGKRISSRVGRKGIVEKVGMFLIIALCNILDQVTGLGDPMLRTVVTWLYIGNESWSIIENFAEVGVPIPQRLREVLIILRERKDRFH